jgi:hypothetical protein
MVRDELTAHRSDSTVFPVWQWFTCSCGWQGSKFMAFLNEQPAPEIIHQEIRDHLRT